MPERLANNTAVRVKNTVIRTVALSACVAAGFVACSRSPDRITYDDFGVPENVLALIPQATTWARTQHRDALLYRIELRRAISIDTVPQVVLYSFYSPSARTFLTATSGPDEPLHGADPQRWPDDRAEPAPLPPLTIDFSSVWQTAAAIGVQQVSSVLLSVNVGNTVPLVAWTVVGALPDMRERGVFLNALSGERLNGSQLLDPPTTPTQSDAAASALRSAFQSRGSGGGSNACQRFHLAVVTDSPSTICYDLAARSYTSPTTNPTANPTAPRALASPAPTVP